MALMLCTKTVRWDNWGHTTVVAHKGDIVDVTPTDYHYPGNWGVMESLYHSGVSDVVNIDEHFCATEPYCGVCGCELLPDHSDCVNGCKATYDART